jgi:hypothetical protein
LEFRRKSGETQPGRILGHYGVRGEIRTLSEDGVYRADGLLQLIIA